MKKLKRNILILSAGRRVELVVGFQNALARHFPQNKVFATDMHPELSAACVTSHRGYLAPRVTDSNYIPFLLDVCDQNDIGLVIPTIDTELMILSKALADFERLQVNLVISDQKLISACRDKRRTNALFETLEIDQPRVYDRNSLEFPCFCKPYDGSRSIGALALLTSDMLTESILMDERNMFMELIDNTYKEVTIDAYYDKNGKLRCAVPRERIEVRAGEVSKGITRKGFVYEYLLDKLKYLEGARGCITAQVFLNADIQSIKALEINPRFGGGYPLALAAGADYPDWLIREYFLHEELPFYEDWESNLMMLRYDAKILVHDED
ncbi:ATP-grasp domain-containing protein [Alcaligenaceae bacterium]|nr:ATP-grasp domain-containing protein [Alcaligenaceae bacterium]